MEGFGKSGFAGGRALSAGPRSLFLVHPPVVIPRTGRVMGVMTAPWVFVSDNGGA